MTSLERNPPDGSPPDLEATVYAHLRAIAQSQMNNERADHTLTATALVHEAYLRLAAGGAPVDRKWYVHAAAEAMRRILIDHARTRGRMKHGGGVRPLALELIGDVADLACGDRAEEIVAFDAAFERLEQSDRRLAQVVRLRFFAGLTLAETAQVLGLSERTVSEDWTYARLWLAREIQAGQDR